MTNGGVYKKVLFGEDCFGNKYYHAIIDECVVNNTSLGDYLTSQGYSVLVINSQPLKGVPDELISHIALLNNSVVITSDEGFRKRLLGFHELSFRVIYFHKSRPKSWNSIVKELDELIIQRVIAYNLDKVIAFFNTAGPEELSLLPGVNEKRIGYLISAREQELFSDLSDLSQRVKRISNPFRFVKRRALWDLNYVDDNNVILALCDFELFKTR